MNAYLFITQLLTQIHWSVLTRCAISGYESQKQYKGTINAVLVLSLYVRQNVASVYMQYFITHKEAIERICHACAEKKSNR